MTWDLIKHLLVLAHCRYDSKCYKDNIENEKMIIVFVRDYGAQYASSIFISLKGVPPKAYALLKIEDGEELELTKENDQLRISHALLGKENDTIKISAMKIIGSDLSDYKLIKKMNKYIAMPVDELSIKELFTRKDVIIREA